MYGLLCENIKNLIITKHGEDTWQTVRELIGLKNQSFVLHDVYSDEVICRIARAYSQTTGESVANVMHQTGVNFVSFVEANGYSQLLNVLGRNMRDFLNGLDSLHEYLRFSYPKLRPPSFFVEKETADGMILHYASKRVGFLDYVVGQIKEVGKKFYNVSVDVEVLDYKDDDNGCHVVLDLLFDNKDYASLLENNYVADENHQDSNNLFVDADLFFEIFPFYIMIDKELIINSVGNGLSKVMNNDIVGKKIDELFQLIRPTFEFVWENLVYTNTLFELVAKECQKTKGKKRRIHLRGNMMFLSSMQSILFLASPILESVEQMYDVGVYIHDLALHDLSRDLALHCLHYSEDLKLVLDKERHKSAMLEESVQCLEKEKKRADSLLYRMIPKQIADRLRKGESTLNMCETFENVTILFSDVVGFTNICTKISPMEVVTMLNSMYMKFDQLSVQFGVYKVETIGDGYMLASGIPVPTEQHADNVADMALEMHNAIKLISNPTGDEKDGSLEIRTGVHSGMVVAGVVGIKMPRYCLFGDTVNIASKMESSGSPHASHISEATKNALTEDKYCTLFRGNFGIKGVYMKTYWLLGIKEDNAVVSFADASRYLPVEITFSKLSRESSPVCGSASQKLLSPELDDFSVDERRGLMDSPSNFVTQSTYSEMEQYIINNNIALFSDDSNTTDCLASLSSSHALSKQSSFNQNLLDSSNSSKQQQKDGNSLDKSHDGIASCSLDDAPCSSHVNKNAESSTSKTIKQKRIDEYMGTKCSLL